MTKLALVAQTVFMNIEIACCNLNCGQIMYFSLLQFKLWAVNFQPRRFSFPRTSTSNTRPISFPIYAALHLVPAKRNEKSCTVFIFFFLTFLVFLSKIFKVCFLCFLCLRKGESIWFFSIFSILLISIFRERGSSWSYKVGYSSIRQIPTPQASNHYKFLLTNADGDGDDDSENDEDRSYRKF